MSSDVGLLTYHFFLFFHSQYGEEEVCSDRLDADFPDFDLSQLDASDFDSVNCLSELHWCNEHSDHSPASIQYSAGDPELFEVGTIICTSFIVHVYIVLISVKTVLLLLFIHKVRGY